MKVPQISGKEAIKVLQKEGFFIVSQRGSHVKLRKYFKPMGKMTVIVPLHRTLKKGTLNEVLKQAEIKLERFLELLK